MVTVLVPPAMMRGTPQGAAIRAGLTDDQWERLATHHRRLVNVLEPLARATSRATLEEMLNSSVVPWAAAVRDIMEILFASSSARELLYQFAARMETDLESLARTKADLFGVDTLEQFLGALSSLQGLTTWAIETFNKGGTEAQRASLMAELVGRSAIHAQMAISTIVLILADDVSDWLPESLSVLSSAADEYMTQVEDIFLSLMPRTLAEDEMVEYEDGRQ